MKNRMIPRISFTDMRQLELIEHSLKFPSRTNGNPSHVSLHFIINPTEFDPAGWAALAKLCGFRYAVFTNKHHSGFCMFPTKTTGFSIANMLYQKDVTKMYVDAFRAAGTGGD